MTNTHFIDSCVALVLGIGCGLFLSAGGQKLLNQYNKNTCNNRPGHNLIYTKTFIGDSYYCINAKYLN